ncbi:unnamed protein product [Linum tenue]|uniref:GPN-loop GTPase 2 n=1 Tax=Linum tenue TaxID=586396 RepID=A0AAV0P138_9ROSI|nr:unnamed protein product [Linum tenue]
MVFGQVVIGPPGSGKTTYCNGMSQFLRLIGRKVAVINLDPANDSLPYDCAVNIEDLIKLSDVMAEHSLGPNGGLVYCMDFLEKNIDWLQSKLQPLLKGAVVFLVLYNIMLANAKNVIMKLIKKLNLRLTAVHLVDAHLCSDAAKYVSGLLLSLSTMLHLELPHINVLSKIDLIENYGKKSNGYIFAGIDASAVEFSKIAVRQTDWDYYRYPYLSWCFYLFIYLELETNITI